MRFEKLNLEWLQAARKESFLKILKVILENGFRSSQKKLQDLLVSQS